MFQVKQAAMLASVFPFSLRFVFPFRRFACSEATSIETPMEKINWISSDFHKMLRSPQDYKEIIYDSDHDLLSRNICTIKHPFPKAQTHLMILPTCQLPHWKNVNETHLHLFYEMKERAMQITKELPGGEQNVKMGLFAVVGALFVLLWKQIGLHIISEDMSSPQMNTKRLWNMYNSDYFVNIDHVISTIEKDGAIEFDNAHYLALLKKPIKCKDCNKEFQSSKTYVKHSCMS